MSVERRVVYLDGLGRARIARLGPDCYVIRARDAAPTRGAPLPTFGPDEVSRILEFLEVKALPDAA